MVVIYVVGWGTNGELASHRKDTIKSLTADNLVDYFQTKMGWGVGQCGVILDAKGFRLLEWGWSKTYGHKILKGSVPITLGVKGWEKYASKSAVAKYKDMIKR